jgi:hypothetical protein
LGRLTDGVPLRDFKHLKIGQWYTVAREFADYDRLVHPVGESWQFLGHNFVPYHDGLSLFVSPDGESERHIRMQWMPEEQAAIIDDLENYIQPKP